MDLDKLEHLQTVLEGVRDRGDTFNLAHWHREKHDDFHNCKTSACSLGWAAMDPTFNTLGLTLTYDSFHDAKVPTYQGKTGMAAGMCFFDLSMDAGTYLFGAGNQYNYKDVGGAIDRLQRMIAACRPHNLVPEVFSDPKPAPDYASITAALSTE